MFSSFAFISQSHDYGWAPKLIWLHVLSDSCIALAFFSILIAIVYRVQKQQDMTLSYLLLLFGAFILAGGITHIMQIWTLWHPNDRISSVIRAVTAIVNLMTALSLIPILHRAVKTPEHQERTETDELAQQSLTQMRELQMSEERFQLALDGSGDGLWDWNISTSEVYLSPQWQEMLGYQANELPGQVSTWKNLIHPDEYDDVMEILAEHLQNSLVPYSFDYRVKMKSGAWKWIGNCGQVVARNEKGEPIRMVGIHTDISDRKQREQNLKDALTEKNVMLQEIHHRVKNNLQVVSSLLNLQTVSKDQQIAEVLKECRNRVKSMALIHEHLYQDKTLSRINLESYITSLTKNLLKSYRSEASKTKIHVETSNLSLGLDTAIPCGLIINELVSNALKYAFPKAQRGEVKIQISKQVNQNLMLTIADNGVGLPSDLNIEQTKTMGLRIVKALIQQISGTLRVNREAGTSFHIDFPGNNT